MKDLQEKSRQQTVIALAEEIGFDQVGPVNMAALIPRREVRDMCAADRCKNYNKSWSCPPSPICGELPVMEQKMKSYSWGILVQTTGQMEDAYDMHTIRSTEKRQKSMFDTLVRQLRRIEGKTNEDQEDFFAMTSGGCRRCFSCTWPDRPCRYPKLLFPSMEACGLWVSDVCKQSEILYNYGENTITYTACILFDKKGEGI